jgi:aspartyl-tRNA(Asn)/glutamyl-tRNA(Gln) amidotransferase subunit A
MSISNSTESKGRPGEDVAWLGVTELTEGYRTGELSPVEVARALLARIAALNGQVNAIVHVDEAYTLGMAEASEARWRAGEPLSAVDGVPITIKDLSAVAGMPRRRGSRLFPTTPVDWDTPAVARLREAGAVFLAKTATPEAGCMVVTESAIHGITRNPYDLEKTPGGSSGGAAVALALGLGPLALGSDGAGSIRIPASHTNLVGIKPGFGPVPAYPPDIDMPHSVVGPLARTVRDAAIMLEVISRPEPRDAFAWPIPYAPPNDLDAPDLSDLKIAVSPRLGCAAPLVDSEVDALIAEAGPLLADAGAQIMAEDPIWPVDPFLPFRVFWETACHGAVEGTPEARRALLEPLILSVGRLGAKVSLTGFFAAQEQRMAIASAAKLFFDRYDLLVGPVTPVPAYAAGLKVPLGFADEDWNWCPYTYPFNMTGQPAASVPIGFTAAGLPVGVQIVGRIGGEANVLRAARAIELRRPLYLRHPPLLTT